MFWLERRPRTPAAATLAGYPPRVRRLFFWYDSLSDWQRVEYAGAAILFLLACAGYLLGLGSTVLLQRVDVEAAALAAQDSPSLLPTATVVAVEAAMLAEPTPAPATPTVQPSPTRGPTASPLPTPFNPPLIAEPRAVPRNLPEAPAQVVPAAPLRTPTPVVTRPRNLETSKPEPPAGSVLTPTPGLARAQPALATAVRQLPAATPASRPTVAPTSAAPPPAPATPTLAAAHAATPPPLAATPVKTPLVR